MTSNKEFIFPNQSISQIATEPDSSVGGSNSQSASSSRVKSIGAYFIVENNPLSIAEAKKYLPQSTSVVYLNALIAN
jgi:hypothetical protein